MSTEPVSDIHGYGLASARPTAGIVGRYYFATDTSVLYRDNGTTWDTQTSGGGGGGGSGDPTLDTLVWMPLTTVVGGVPELVWDGDDSLIPTLVPLA